MSKNQSAAIPSQDHVLNSGNALETTGNVIVFIGLLGGIILTISAGNPYGFGLIPVGLLILITGYVKKSAAVNAALFIIKMHERESAASFAPKTEPRN